MASIPVTLLDAAQVIQHSYDESENRIRVDIGANVTLGGELEVAISDTDDSIQIGNGSGQKLAINSDGSINVVLENEAPTGSSVVRSVYNEVLAVASGTTTQINTYTVPVAKTAVLEKITVSGENIALFTVQLNGTTIDALRTGYITLNGTFDFLTGNSDGYTLVTGDIVTVQTLQMRPSVSNYECRIQINEIGT